MKLTIENGKWKLGDKLIDSTSVPLNAVVLAAEKLYPNLTVELDFSLSPNPWFGKRLFQYMVDPISIEFKDIILAALAEEFKYTEEKICTRCGETAFYNADAKAWKCLGCDSVYFASQRPLQFIVKRKIKNPRRFEVERKREYFGKRTIKKP